MFRSPTKSVSLFLLILGLSLLVIQVLNKFKVPLTQEVKIPELISSSAAPVPRQVNLASASADLAEKVTANSVYALDLQSASTLFQKSEAIAAFPASTTKMMTALVARQQYPLDDWVTITRAATAAEGNTVGWYEGEVVSVADLLKGLLIFSGNDAAEALANYHPLGRVGFIHDMNALAQQLHLTSTHFTNPSGLDDPRQVTSARDLTLLAKEVVSDDFLGNVVASPTATITTQQGRTSTLYSTNQLLKYSEYQGVKTGTTPEAGEVLISKVSIKDHPVLITLLKSENRYSDMQMIVQWLTETYDWLEIANLPAE